MTILARAALAVVVVGLLAAGAAHAQVAKVLRIEGAAMVDHIGQQRRFLGVGEQLEEKAVVTVAKESFVMLEFRDETRVTLRPNTVFRVEAFADQAPEKISFGLAKGGLRAISGLVGKRKPEVIQINATTAYIGVRGTEFDARLCEQDCESEDRSSAPPRTTRAVVAARIVEIDGIAVATGSTLPSRMLSPGAVIYERDSIATAPGAYVVLAFADGSRASLTPNSTIAVQQFRFDESRPELHIVNLRLFEGGVRVLTGAISRHRPEAFRITTTVGPIDPRGTLFDAFCNGACVDAKSNARAEMQRFKEQADRYIAQANAQAGVIAASLTTPALAVAPAPSDGLVVQTLEGMVLVGEGEQVQVPQGATMVVSERGAAPRIASQTFAYIAQTKAPRPDRVTVDPALFDQQKAQSYEPGLYVWVREGSISLQPIAQTALSPADNEPIRLAAASGGTSDTNPFAQRGTGPLIVNAGEAAVITPKQVALLPNVPIFMRLDSTPLPTRANVPVSLPFFQAKDGSTVGLCSPP
jgi:hypothetical protein